MAHQNEINPSENLKIYDEILAIKRICENQENDLLEFDVILSSLPVDNIMFLKEFSTLIFEFGLQNIDSFNLDSLFHEALKERIENINIVKKLQLENRKLEGSINQEMQEIKNIEDGKTDLHKCIIPLTQTTKEISILEKQIATMQDKQSQFSTSSLKCIDQLLLKLDQIDVKKIQKKK